MNRVFLVGLLFAIFCVRASAAEYLTLEWSFDTRASNNNIYVLNMDDDPSLEIVADSGRAGIIFGIDRTGEQLWRTNIPGIIFDLYAREFEDNRNEIIAGTTPRAYSISGNGSYNWRYFTEHEKVGRVYLDDFYGDGRGEAVLSVAGGFRGNKILVVDEDGQRILKIGFRSGDYPNVLRAADLDGDGTKELVVGFGVYSVNTISESMQLGYVRDASVRAFKLDGTLLWSYPTSGGVKVLETADINGDGVEEIIAGSRGVVYAIDAKGVKVWEYATNTLINDLKIRDIDSDGVPEIVAGSDRVHVISANGSKIVKTSKLGEVTSVDAADFDGDGNMEFIAGSGGVHVFDREGEKIWSSTGVKYTTCVVAADLNQDGFLEVVAGSGTSQVRTYSSKPYMANKKAERFLSDATVLYGAGDLDVSETKAERARLLYESLVSIEGVDDARALISDIGLHRQANEMLALARGKYENKSIAEAVVYANKSKALYASLGLSKRALEASEVLDSVRVFPQAEGNLSLARSLLASGEYLTASERAVSALEKYEWLGEAEGAAAASGIVEAAKPYLTAAAHLTNASTLLSDGMYVSALSSVSAAEEIYGALDYTLGLRNASSLERDIRKTRLMKSRLFWMEVVLLVPLTLLTVVLLTAVYFVRRHKRKKDGGTHLALASDDSLATRL